MSTLFLNIGLLVDRPLVKYEIAATTVFKAMRRVGIGHVNGIVHQSGEEPTMVCEVEATDAQVYQLAVMLDQDCIAVWDLEHCEGRLVGPQAAKWLPFNGAYFHLPERAQAGGGVMAQTPFETELCEFGEAASIVERYHYSQNLPNVVRKNYKATRDGLTLAVACFGPCVSRKVPSDWLELRRLVKLPGAELILSSFLSRTIRELRKERRHPAILSWADPEQDHHGGIYQATNWVYTEQRGGGNHTFVDENGVHIHPRTVYARLGTQSVPKVLAMNPGWTSFLPKTKHRYLMPLELSLAECLATLKTKKMPYPKPHGGDPLFQ